VSPRTKPTPEPRRRGRPTLHGERMESRSVLLPAALWLELDREAHKASRPGERVSTSEILRRRLGSRPSS
jgi:hypothetical protein